MTVLREIENPGVDELLAILGGSYVAGPQTVAGYSGPTYVTLEGANGNVVRLHDSALGPVAEAEELTPTEQEILEVLRAAVRSTRRPAGR